MASHGATDAVRVNERASLTLMSHKSTECYRNWWPGPDDAMVHLMNRSIDLLEDLALPRSRIHSTPIATAGNHSSMRSRGHLIALLCYGALPPRRYSLRSRHVS